MTSSLFLAFLFLTPTTVVTLRAGGPCPACWEAASDLESQRELLLNLAKRSILDKLHLSQRPTLSRPVSKTALRTALKRLHGFPQGTLLEDDPRQEYEIISFAETGPKHLHRHDPPHFQGLVAEECAFSGLRIQPFHPPFSRTPI